jgi:hypothetical protein
MQLLFENFIADIVKHVAEEITHFRHQKAFVQTCDISVGDRRELSKKKGKKKKAEERG